MIFCNTEYRIQESGVRNTEVRIRKIAGEKKD